MDRWIMRGVNMESRCNTVKPTGTPTGPEIRAPGSEATAALQSSARKPSASPVKALAVAAADLLSHCASHSLAESRCGLRCLLPPQMIYSEDHGPQRQLVAGRRSAVLYASADGDDGLRVPSWRAADRYSVTKYTKCGPISPPSICRA